MARGQVVAAFSPKHFRRCENVDSSGGCQNKKGPQFERKRMNRLVAKKRFGRLPAKIRMSLPIEFGTGNVVRF